MRRSLYLPWFLSTLVSAGLFTEPGQAGVAPGWVRKTDMPERRFFPYEAPISALGKLYYVSKETDRIVEYDPKSETWTTRAPMPTKRHHYGTAQVNGRIFVIGGCDGPVDNDAAHVRLATVEEYDPANDTWRARTSMPTPRMALGVVAVNGKIYAIGGTNHPDQVGAVEEYNPATDTWVRKRDWARPRAEVWGAVAIWGRVYLFGTDFLEIYDTSSDTFQPGKARPGGPRSGFGVTVVNGRIYSFGGRGKNVTNFEVYDPSSDNWTTLPDAPKTARDFAGIASVNQKLYLLGGLLGDNWQDRDNGVFEFDPEVRDPQPEAPGWTRKAPMPLRRPFPHQQPVEVNGRIYIVADETGMVYEYDPAADRWEPLSSRMPSVRHHWAAASLRGKIYVIGGCSRPDGENRPHKRVTTVEEYDPASNAWRARQSMPTPRMGPAAVVFDGKIYVIGGIDAPNQVNAVEIYDPATDSWEQSSPWTRQNEVVWGAAVIGERIFLCGSSFLDAYTPSTGKFESKAGRSGGARHGFGVAGLGGKIYNFCGMGQGNDTECYDPATDTWTTLPASPKRAKGYVGTVAVAGKAYVMGGVYGPWEDQDNSVFEFSPLDTTERRTVSKTVLENLPEGSNFKTVVLGGKIYAIKYGPDYDVATDRDYLEAGKLYVYDPTAETWEARTDMPVKKLTYSLVELGGKIYVIGGFVAKDTPTASIEEYDPATDSWSVKEPMPTPRCRVGTVVLDGRIYALGGWARDVETDVVEVYDPAQDRWQVKNRLPARLMGVSAVVVNNRIYMLRGVSVSSGHWEFVYDFREYDPRADRWISKAPWRFEREPEELIVAGERLFVVGAGAFSPPGTHSLKEYVFASDQWVLRGDMPAANAHTVHASWAVLEGSIYTFGGGVWRGSGWQASDHAQRYDPSTDTWEELEPLSEGKIGMGVAAVNNRIFVFGGEKMGTSGQSAENVYSRKIERYEVTAAGSASDQE
jgi:N-acetylneuraminic acid mutarotase